MSRQTCPQLESAARPAILRGQYVFLFFNFPFTPADDRFLFSTPASESVPPSPCRASARTAAHQATVLAAQVQAAAGQAAVQEAMDAFSSMRLKIRAAHEKQKVEAAQAALRVAAVRVQRAFRAKQAAHRDAQKAAEEAAQEAARMEKQESDLRALRKEMCDAENLNNRFMRNLEAQCVFVWMYRAVHDTCILPGACIPHAVRLSDECILLYRKTVRLIKAIKFSEDMPQISIVDFPYPLNPSRREVQAVHRVRASIIELYDLEGQALVAIWESIKHLELHNGQADEQWRAIIDALNSHRDGVGQELSSQVYIIKHNEPHPLYNREGYSFSHISSPEHLLTMDTKRFSRWLWMYGYPKPPPFDWASWNRQEGEDYDEQ